MILRSQQIWQGGSWQQQLSEGFRHADQLLAALDLPAENNRGADTAFPLRVPRGFAGLMEPGNRHDPLLLQVLPAAEEMQASAGFGQNPLNEDEYTVAPGLIHKYAGRALMIVSPACAINCRYCFRRHFPYEQNNPSQAEWQQALDWLAARPDIEEIILSGGDPLAVSNRYLGQLLTRLEDIPHLKRLRIHTRLPVVLPPRLDQELLDLLHNSRFQTVVVLHCNHPREITPELASAVSALRQIGITTLNQAVLLKNVNGDLKTLSQLSDNLFAAGILPYYLHTLDPVDGAAHFAMEDTQALDLHRQLADQLPGYLVPRLVREVPGHRAKTPLIELLE